ncbi:MFS transporter [Saccharopolyspora sp. MS10]|uniref:MFS transporter n=1 Tax=Saccharopolyspora sp. MS10 TaxID=3385973 RepID=UPI00399F59F1
MSVVTGAEPSDGDGGSPTAEEERGDPRRWLIMAVLSAVAFMAQLDFFIVNVAVDGIGRSFGGASTSAVSWVLSAYAIVFAALLVPAGRLADLHGRKRMLLAGVVVFTLGSALASFAPSLPVLVAARAVQAVGAAMSVPPSLGLLYPSFPRRQHTLVVGLWAGVAGVAAMAGPPLGGLLGSLDWRWIFLINLPIGLLTILGGAWLLPEVREPAGRPLPDVVSTVSLLAAVSALVLATTQGPEWGWSSPRTIVLFAAAAVFAVVTVRRGFTAAAPIIEPALFASREFTAAALALLGLFAGFAIFLFGGALFLQQVWHFSVLEAGMGIAAAPIVSVGFAMSAGLIRRRFGRVLPAAVGTLTMSAAAGYWLLTVTDEPAYWSTMFPGLVLMGVSGGLSQAPLFAAAGALPPDRATTGSAVLNMSRQVGSAVGVALLVAIVAAAPSARTFGHAWILQIALGVLAAVSVLLPQRRTTVRPARQRTTSRAAEPRSRP